MAVHTFICPKCNKSTQDTTAKDVHVCDCGANMYWDLRGANWCPGGDYDFTSLALAMHPDQIAEHKAAFPDVDVTPDGCPRFNSVKQRERYMDKCGFHKPAQSIRK